ncbi:MAG: hypothetical protein EA384_11410 [Spirochaetaceae bacterium]|nr:MAG: hypothetical protein EA384_11410 [Spirochaetaceae bacterium]
MADAAPRVPRLSLRVPAARRQRALRAAYDGFDVATVAAQGEADRARLPGGIVREPLESITSEERDALRAVLQEIGSLQ